jgi:hypothetical protein
MTIEKAHQSHRSISSEEGEDDEKEKSKKQQKRKRRKARVIVCDDKDDEDEEERKESTDADEGEEEMEVRSIQPKRRKTGTLVCDDEDEGDESEIDLTKEKEPTEDEGIVTRPRSRRIQFLSAVRKDKFATVLQNAENFEGKVDYEQEKRDKDELEKIEATVENEEESPEIFASFGPICNCKPPTQSALGYTNDDKKAYYSHRRCGFFAWAKDTKGHLSAAGPNCLCGQSSRFYSFPYTSFATLSPPSSTISPASPPPPHSTPIPPTHETGV